MQGSHSPGITGKPGIWPKKIHAWKNHKILEKGQFHGKIMEFCFSYPIFFNIRIHVAKFILCHMICFFLSLIFDYGWLHVPKSFDVKTILANNSNLGKLHMQP